MEGYRELIANKKIRILLCVELLLIAFGIAGLFRGSRLAVGTEDTEQLLGEGVSLPAGVYTARLYCESEEDGVSIFQVVADGMRYKTLLCNPAPIYSGIPVQECQFYLTDRVNQLRIVVSDYGEKPVFVQGAEIVTGTEGSRIYLFWLLVFCITLDSFIALALFHKKKPIPPEKQMVLFGIPLLALLSSLPVLVDYNIQGVDLSFHLMRIEALAQNIRQNQMFARLEGAWLAGHGYANSIFYGDTFLLPAALLRILGFHLTDVYRFYIVAVNLATALISYICFRKCSDSRYIGMFGCVLYLFFPYRIYNIYNRAAVGEYTAMVFLPLLALGFYKIYTEDTKGKGYLRNWGILAAGFTGIIQSHLLSCEMVGVFTVLLCLLLWKKTFFWRTFRVLALTVVMTIALNAWFLIPLVDLMAADGYYLGHNAGIPIQHRGVYLAHLFYTLQAAGSSSHFSDNGMVDTEPIGIGMALLICLFMGCAVFLKQSRSEAAGRNMIAKQEKKAIGIALGLGLVAFFMSTYYFPWDLLGKSSKLAGVLTGSLQFPTRLTGIAGICIVMAACIMGKGLLREKEGAFQGMLLLISAVSVVFGAYQLNDILLDKEEPIRLYTAQNLGHSAVLGAEYLPENADLSHLIHYHMPVCSEGVKQLSYDRKGLCVDAYVKTGEEGGYIEYPLLYYKGYEAQSKDTGEKLTVVKGNNADVRVLFPENFSGQIQVKYKGMWYWRVAETISVFVGAAILLCRIRIRINGKRGIQTNCVC